MSKPEPFPLRLHNVVTNSRYIEWSEEGDSFFIRDNLLFEQNELQTSFNNKSMLSFSRQLLSYGFIRITDCRTSKEGSDNNFAAFYHPNFKRGCIEEARNIKKIDKTKPKIGNSKFVYMDPFKPARMKKKKDNNSGKQ